MKATLRSTLASWVASAILRYEERRVLRLLRWLPSAVRPILQGGLSRALFAEPLRVQTPRGSLAFVVLGETAAVRARALLAKQPCARRNDRPDVYEVYELFRKSLGDGARQVIVLTALR